MWKKISKLLGGKELDIRERMLRAIIVIGGIATLIAIVEIVLVMEVSELLLPMLILLVVCMGVSLFVTFKYHKYDLAATLLGIMIVMLLMPSMFVMSGAIHSGASVWLALGILYIFIMFRGKKMFIFLGMATLVYGYTYLCAYKYPDAVLPMVSEAAAYIDAYFSVMAVGIISGLLLKAHMNTFEEEHKLNIQQREALKEAGEAKNALFANMSHEIRTPINAIIGLNEMILRENPTGNTADYARDIRIASQMLLNQVNDILDLSQVEMKRMEIVSSQYNTADVFVELAEMVRGQMEKKGLDFFTDIDPNIPSVLIGDEKRLRQVFLNILDNAVKYTEEGSVTLTVQGEELSEDEIALKVSVADTGIGIRKENIEHIYDSYNRVDEKRNAGIIGSGLGLAITKQLIDLMGGEISIDSIYTKGTTFTVVVKQKIAVKEPMGSLDARMKDNVPDEGYKPMFEAPEARILIVDDNRMNAVVARRLLEATKAQIDVVNSGQQCLEMTKQKYYHVILLDYLMPDMNGAETLKNIRKQENGLCRETAVIAVTANALSGSRERYLEQGFDGYVEKPIQSKLIEKEIMGLLPIEIIEYMEMEELRRSENSLIQEMAKRRRKKVYITADCVCDIPQEMMEKYDIKVMYLYINTPSGRFMDTREIDADSLTDYIVGDSSSATVASVTVEEYEEFFANALTEAERVIHISVAARSSNSYDIAVKAAKGFDHVRVVDSGQISGGEGLLALYGAKLAKEGMPAKDIYNELERIKGNIHTRFIVPGANILHQNQKIRNITVNLCRTFDLHPCISMRQGKVIIKGLYAGNLQKVWKQVIRFTFRNKKKIDREIVFVTHVGCNVKQQEYIKREIQKCIPFKKVLMQKASFSNACITGMETIGIAYFTVPKQK